MKHGRKKSGALMPAIGVATLVALLTLVPGCASRERPPPPSLDDIVKMTAEGQTDETIIALLLDSRAIYPMSSTTIVSLHEQGVTIDVLDQMQKAYVDHERRMERWRYSDPYWAWGYPCYGCWPRRHPWGWPHHYHFYP